jgi:hypothetical protein
MVKKILPQIVMEKNKNKNIASWYDSRFYDLLIIKF